MHLPYLVFLKNMDYFFQILVDQISMIVGKIIDPILACQKESYFLLQDVASALDLIAVVTHKTAAVLMRTIYLPRNTLFV